MYYMCVYAIFIVKYLYLTFLTNIQYQVIDVSKFVHIISDTLSTIPLHDTIQFTANP